MREHDLLADSSTLSAMLFQDYDMGFAVVPSQLTLRVFDEGSDPVSSEVDVVLHC